MGSKVAIIRWGWRVFKVAFHRISDGDRSVWSCLLNATAFFIITICVFYGTVYYFWNNIEISEFPNWRYLQDCSKIIQKSSQISQSHTLDVECSTTIDHTMSLSTTISDDKYGRSIEMTTSLWTLLWNLSLPHYSKCLLKQRSLNSILWKKGTSSKFSLTVWMPHSF